MLPVRIPCGFASEKRPNWRCRRWGGVPAQTTRMESPTVVLASSWSSSSPAKVAVRRHHGGLAGGGEVVGDDVRHLRPQMGFGVPTFSRLACPSNWDHTCHGGRYDHAP